MGVFGARFYEEPRYEVLARIDHRTEIRRYAPRLAVQIELPQVDRSGRDEAFRTLFAYIAGANNASGSANARIAMTVPVALELPTRIPMTIPGLTSEGVLAFACNSSCQENTISTRRRGHATNG